MTATLFVQSILAGLTNGFVYGLVGLGISIVFRGTRVVNAMQGDFALVAGIIAYVTLNLMGAPMPVALVGGTVGGGVLGWLVERLLVRPTRRRGGNDDSLLLVTLGGAFAVSAGALLFFGRDSRALTGLGGDGSFTILDAAIRIHAVWLIVISLILVGALKLAYSRTPLGQSMMAASIDPDGAATIGINVGRMRGLTFALGGAVGGLAGVLIAPLVTVQYEMGLMLTLKGFTAAIIGCIGNPFGAVLGGLLLGLVEALAIVFVSSGYKDVIAMGLLIAIMILMPHGLLGRRGRVGG